MNMCICKNCGKVTKLKNEQPGCEGCFAFILLFFICSVLGFLLPFVSLIIFVIGIIVILVNYCVAKKTPNRCSKCSAENCLVPIDSVVGEELLQQYYDDESIERIKNRLSK